MKDKKLKYKDMDFQEYYSNYLIQGTVNKPN